MSDSSSGFLRAVTARDGMIDVACLLGALEVTRQELAAAAGLPPETIAAPGGASPSAQARLRDVAEIVGLACAWSGSARLAFLWYRTTELPSLGRTAASLVRAGRVEVVKCHMRRIAAGGYA